MQKELCSLTYFLFVIFALGYSRATFFYHSLETFLERLKFIFVVDQAFGRTAGQPTRTLLNTWKGMWIIAVIS